jgi:hypothetical protein
MRKRKINIFSLAVIFCFIFFLVKWQLAEKEIKRMRAEDGKYLRIKVFNYFNNEWDTAISIASYIFKVQPEYLFAVLIKESNGNPLTVGDKGRSIGGFQIQKHEYDKALKNRWVSAVCAGYILKNLETTYGSMYVALKVYNSGLDFRQGWNYAKSVDAMAKAIRDSLK